MILYAIVSSKINKYHTFQANCWQLPTIDYPPHHAFRKALSILQESIKSFLLSSPDDYGT